MTADRTEADEFYAAVTPVAASADEALVAATGGGGHGVGQAVLPLRRRALARRRPEPTAASSRTAPTSATRHWRHLDAHDVISMPDPWEYPWFAAWDLAFHTVALAHVDPAFAKYQLRAAVSRVVHAPDGGQLPAYEWAFGDVNPPVHAWAALACVRNRRRHRLRLPRASCSTSCSSTSPGGSTAPTPTATTSSKAASSASTTSGRSTDLTRPLRRSARTERCHRVDGNVLRQHAVDCAHLRPSRPHVRRRRTKFIEHFALHRHGDERGGHVGRRRRLLLRHPRAHPRAGSSRCECDRWWASSRCSPRLSSSLTCSRRLPTSATGRLVHRNETEFNDGDRPLLPPIGASRARRLLLSSSARERLVAHHGPACRPAEFLSNHGVRAAVDITRRAPVCPSRRLSVAGRLRAGGVE